MITIILFGTDFDVNYKLQSCMKQSIVNLLRYTVYEYDSVYVHKIIIIIISDTGIYI